MPAEQMQASWATTQLSPGKLLIQQMATNGANVQGTLYPLPTILTAATQKPGASSTPQKNQVSCQNINSNNSCGTYQFSFQHIGTLGQAAETNRTKSKNNGSRRKSETQRTAMPPAQKNRYHYGIDNLREQVTDIIGLKQLQERAKNTKLNSSSSPTKASYPTQSIVVNDTPISSNDDFKQPTPVPANNRIPISVASPLLSSPKPTAQSPATTNKDGLTKEFLDFIQSPRVLDCFDEEEDESESQKFWICDPEVYKKDRESRMLKGTTAKTTDSPFVPVTGNGSFFRQNHDAPSNNVHKLDILSEPLRKSILVQAHNVRSSFFEVKSGDDPSTGCPSRSVPIPSSGRKSQPTPAQVANVVPTTVHQVSVGPLSATRKPSGGRSEQQSIEEDLPKIVACYSLNPKAGNGSTVASEFARSQSFPKPIEKPNSKTHRVKRIPPSRRQWAPRQIGNTALYEEAIERTVVRAKELADPQGEGTSTGSSATQRASSASPIGCAVPADATEQRTRHESTENYQKLCRKNSRKAVRSKRGQKIRKPSPAESSSVESWIKSAQTTALDMHVIGNYPSRVVITKNPKPSHSGFTQTRRAAKQMRDSAIGLRENAFKPTSTNNEFKIIYTKNVQLPLRASPKLPIAHQPSAARYLPGERRTIRGTGNPSSNRIACKPMSAIPPSALASFPNSVKSSTTTNLTSGPLFPSSACTNRSISTNSTPTQNPKRHTVTCENFRAGPITGLNQTKGENSESLSEGPLDYSMKTLRRIEKEARALDDQQVVLDLSLPKKKTSDDSNTTAYPSPKQCFKSNETYSTPVINTLNSTQVDPVSMGFGNENLQTLCSVALSSEYEFTRKSATHSGVKPKDTTSANDLTNTENQALKITGAERPSDRETLKEVTNKEIARTNGHRLPTLDDEIVAYFDIGVEKPSKGKPLRSDLTTEYTASAYRETHKSSEIPDQNEKPTMDATPSKLLREDTINLVSPDVHETVSTSKDKHCPIKRSETAEKYSASPAIQVTIVSEESKSDSASKSEGPASDSSVLPNNTLPVWDSSAQQKPESKKSAVEGGVNKKDRIPIIREDIPTAENLNESLANSPKENNKEKISKNVEISGPGETSTRNETMSKNGNLQVAVLESGMLSDLSECELVIDETEQNESASEVERPRSEAETEKREPFINKEPEYENASTEKVTEGQNSDFKLTGDNTADKDEGSSKMTGQNNLLLEEISRGRNSPNVALCGSNSSEIRGNFSAVADNEVIRPESLNTIINAKQQTMKTFGNKNKDDDSKGVREEERSNRESSSVTEDSDPMSEDCDRRGGTNGRDAELQLVGVEGSNTSCRDTAIDVTDVKEDHGDKKESDEQEVLEVKKENETTGSTRQLARTISLSENQESLELNEPCCDEYDNMFFNEVDLKDAETVEHTKDRDKEPEQSSESPTRDESEKTTEETKDTVHEKLKSQGQITNNFLPLKYGVDGGGNDVDNSTLSPYQFDISSLSFASRTIKKERQSFDSDSSQVKRKTSIKLGYNVHTNFAGCDLKIKRRKLVKKDDASDPKPPKSSTPKKSDLTYILLSDSSDSSDEAGDFFKTKQVTKRTKKSKKADSGGGCSQDRGSKNQDVIQTTHEYRSPTSETQITEILPQINSDAFITEQTTPFSGVESSLSVERGHAVEETKSPSSHVHHQAIGEINSQLSSISDVNASLSLKSKSGDIPTSDSSGQTSGRPTTVPTPPFARAYTEDDTFRSGVSPSTSEDSDRQTPTKINLKSFVKNTLPSDGRTEPTELQGDNKHVEKEPSSSKTKNGKDLSIKKGKTGKRNLFSKFSNNSLNKSSKSKKNGVKRTQKRKRKIESTESEFLENAIDQFVEVSPPKMAKSSRGKPQTSATEIFDTEGKQMDGDENPDVSVKRTARMGVNWTPVKMPDVSTLSNNPLPYHEPERLSKAQRDRNIYLAMQKLLNVGLILDQRPGGSSPPHWPDSFEMTRPQARAASRPVTLNSERSKVQKEEIFWYTTENVDIKPCSVVMKKLFIEKSTVRLLQY